jgi:hypothetical protein
MDRAIELRVQFERNRDVQDPRALATLFQDAQQKVQAMAHPDPYRRKAAGALPTCADLGYTSPVVPGW